MSVLQLLCELTCISRHSRWPPRSRLSGRSSGWLTRTLHHLRLAIAGNGLLQKRFNIMFFFCCTFVVRQPPVLAHQSRLACRQCHQPHWLLEGQVDRALRGCMYSSLCWLRIDRVYSSVQHSENLPVACLFSRRTALAADRTCEFGWTAITWRKRLREANWNEGYSRRC